MLILTIPSGMLFFNMFFFNSFCCEFYRSIFYLLFSPQNVTMPKMGDFGKLGKLGQINSFKEYFPKMSTRGHGRS